MSAFRTATMDVRVLRDDWHDAESRTSAGDAFVIVEAEVDIDEALEEATVDQLREALGREEEGYTQDELNAIRDCFAALVVGASPTASSFAKPVHKLLSPASPPSGSAGANSAGQMFGGRV